MYVNRQMYANKGTFVSLSSTLGPIKCLDVQIYSENNITLSQKSKAFS